MGAKQSFVGVWDLVSFEARLSDGRVITPLGEDAVGRVIYDADGRMSVQIMRRDRPAFASGDMLKGESEEVRAAFEGYIAYSGTYEVREDDACVLHRVHDATGIPRCVLSTVSSVDQQGLPAWRNEQGRAPTLDVDQV